MFNLALDPILRNIPVKGIDLMGVTYKVLAYADDLVIFVQNEEELKAVQKYCKEIEAETGLCVNDSKTLFMPWKSSSTTSTHWEN
jgi:Reverse transcriptase (RNA-dependent DNA polymerase)